MRVFVFEGSGYVSSRTRIIKAYNLIDLIERAHKQWKWVGGIYIQSIHRLVVREGESHWYRLTRPSVFLSDLRAVTLHRRTH